jgi:hypothetical protein
MTKLLPLFPILALALGASACQSADTDAATPPDASAATSSTATTEPEVEYEPAYPGEVSSEGLTEGDVAQQETTHSHGGEEHSHDDGDEHAHDDGDEHEDDDGSHDHGEDGKHDARER